MPCRVTRFQFTRCGTKTMFVWDNVGQCGIPMNQGYTNPDLAFANSQSLPVRHILDMFPWSHYQPSLITIPSVVQSVQGRDVKRWNFRKANWERFTQHVNRAAASLPPPCSNNLNEAYESYCKMLLTAAKKNIPHGIHKAYIPAGMTNVKTYFIPMQKHRTLRIGTKQQTSSIAG